MWTLFYCPLYLVVTCSLCGGDSFPPDDAYDSALDSVMPMKENTPSITYSTKVFGALRCCVVVKVSLLMVFTIMHGTA